MDPGIQQMIKVLEAELGYTESGNGYSKFGDWYEKNVDDSYSFSNAAWCDMFLAWGATQAGVQAKTGTFAYTPSHAAWFKNQGAWGDKPQPGAFVFYDWSGGGSIGGIDHIGIVTEVEGGKIHTIEGNVDGVHAKRKVRDQDQVVGYGYPEKVVPKPEQPAQQQAAATTSTTALTGTAKPPPLDGAQVELSGAFTSVLLPVIALLTRVKRRDAAARAASIRTEGIS
ncbi:CHAP domain-containing protein [Spirillospora sp. NPDC047279]|uniref:CHAP domain-containing protein n=1 Tax=Spirillospora sp. NPDC047279 TaxID=3155478 RepID=UPI0033F400D1